MNKKLVALAVAGAFALPLAAEAQTANVTLYGRLNLDLEFVRADLPAPLARRNAGGFVGNNLVTAQSTVEREPDRSPNCPGRL